MNSHNVKSISSQGSFKISNIITLSNPNFFSIKFIYFAIAAHVDTVPIAQKISIIYSKNNDGEYCS
jgi:hypothetical protein